MKAKMEAKRQKAGKGYLWTIYVNNKPQSTKVVTSSEKLTERDAINKYLSIVYKP